MIGQIIKIHSDFYYVKTDEAIWECKLREIIKKEKKEVFVGDKVKLVEANSDFHQAFIDEILPRNNFIKKPAVANIDQVVVVASFTQPSIDYIQLNRYLGQAKLNNIPAVICINKSDLEDDKEKFEELCSIYEPLGYKVIHTSALEQKGIEVLEEVLLNKVSVLCGGSGVGKSSILNYIKPDLKLKTKQISSKTERGTHTTRHTEFLEIEFNDKRTAIVADTPGFSHLKFDTIMPKEVETLFDEISDCAKECTFNDCLHTQEANCNVIRNLDKIHSSRYESYKAFVEEATEYKEKVKTIGHKEEEQTKTLDKAEKKVKIVKLGTKARDKSRKVKKQDLKNISYYNEDDDFDF